ncbi:MAG: hypothetical protein C0618_11465, partial [Desulfuromonas sp.]
QTIAGGAAVDETFTATATTADGESVSQTVTITVTGANDPPTASDKTVSLATNTSHILSTEDFGFSDVEGEAFSKITIVDAAIVADSGTTGGELLLGAADGSWTTVIDGTEITKAQIDSGYLVFKPDVGESGATYQQFTFKVNDGTVDSAGTNTITYNVATALTVSDPAPIDEGKSAVFIIELSATRSGDTVLDLSVGGDVTAGDYDSTLYYNNGFLANGQIDWQVATSNQVTIPEGQTRVEVKISTISDGTSDNGESLSLTAEINGGTNTDMANTVATGNTTINDYPSLVVNSPIFVSEGNDAIFEITLSGKKTSTTDVTLSLGGEVDTNDYDTTNYEYSSDDGTTWVAVAGDIEGDTITIPLSTSDGGVNDKIQSVLVKITTLNNDDSGTPDSDETLTLNAVTNDPNVATAGIANAGATVSASTVIAEPVSFTTNEDTAYNLTSPAGYTYSELGEAVHGTISDDGSGTLTYTPDEDFSGTDTFTFYKTDAAGITTTVEASVTITPVADAPDVSLAVSNKVVGGFPEAINDGTFSSTGDWSTGSGPGASGNYDAKNYNDNFSPLTPVGGQASIAKGDVIIQVFDEPLTTGAAYTLDFDATTGIDTTVQWLHIDTTTGNITILSDIVTDINSTGSFSVNTSIPATANAIAIGHTDNSTTALVVDNISLEGTVTYTYDVNINNSLNDTDTASTQPEELQEVSLVVKDSSGTVIDSTGFFNQGSYEVSVADTWTFTQDQLVDLTMTVPGDLGATEFSLEATATSKELSNADTISTTVTFTVVDSDDAPSIGDNTLIMANEANFVGSLSDTLTTYFSTNGGNTFSWNEPASNLPDIYVGGEKVALSFTTIDTNADTFADKGSVTGTTSAGTVFTVEITMGDNDTTDVVYTQKTELLGVEVVVDGGIVLPGGGNSDNIILGFNDSGGSASGVDAIITAHNLIEDTYNEINDIDGSTDPTYGTDDGTGTEHTVNTNNYYIGVDSNNMNAGDQLILDFTTVSTDGDGNTSHNNEVSAMEISLFNFGSVKSGDELYITVLTEGTSPGIDNADRETIILTGDPDLTELKYTVTSSGGGTFIGVEFLAGNESSFKLGIESISAISYNTDFDMQLAYSITDADEDSDTGSITISLDGDEVILYDSSKTAIDAGKEQKFATADNDVLELGAYNLIDFADPSTPELRNFEIIELTDGEADTIDNMTFGIVDLLTDASDAGNNLKIRGDSTDIVNLQNDANTWSLAASAQLTADGYTYDIYTSDGGATVYVESTMSGSFIDAAVIGIQYVTSSNDKGLTDHNGSFSYRPGDTVTFMLGNLVIAELDTADMPEDGQLFLQDLAGVDRTDLSDPYVINLAVLLQSIDENRIAEDGLTITDAVHQAFDDDAVDLRDLSAEDVIALLDEAGIEAVPQEQAMSHVRDELIARTELTATDFSDSQWSVSDPGIGTDIIDLNLPESGSSPQNISDQQDMTGEAETTLSLSDVLHSEDSLDEALASISSETQAAQTAVPEGASAASLQNDFYDIDSPDTLIIQSMIDQGKALVD